MASNTTETANEQLFGGYSGRLLSIVALGTMTTMASRLVLPPLLPRITEELGISNAEAGMALTLLWGAVAVSQFPGGRLSDRLTFKTTLVGALGLMAIAIVILGNAVSFPGFLVGVTVLGVGVGIYQPAAFAQLSDLFVRQRGRAFGINAGAFDLGGAVAAGLAVLVVGAATWRTAMLPIFVVVIVAIVGIHLYCRQPYRVERVDFDAVATIRRLFGVPRLRRTLLAFALFNFVWQGSINFLPTFLQMEKGVTPTLASNAFAAIFLVGVLVKPSSGYVGDRFGFTTVAMGMPVLSAVGLLTLVFGQSRATLAVGVLAFAVGIAAYYPLMSTHLMNSFPDESRGGDFGAARSVFFGVGSLGSVFVGALSEVANFSTAFLLFVAGLLVCAIITLMLDEQ